MQQSWDELRYNYSLLFPDRKVSSLAFGSVFRETDIERNNDYVLAGVKRQENRAAGLLVTRPEWDPTVISRAVRDGFSGIKPYPDLAPVESSEVSIFDFAPKEHLAALDETSGILMLHLPRAGRLADKDNIRELTEISQTYPSIKLIVAHIGRSFCLPTASKGLPSFVQAANIFFDTSANLNADVFQYALETVGPDRILFGSDLPITLMRGMREHLGDKYVNYTDAPYSWNVNRKSPSEEARYTYFLYEEIRAIITAMDRSGLGKEIAGKIFYSNSARLLGGKTC